MSRSTLLLTHIAMGNKHILELFKNCICSSKNLERNLFYFHHNGCDAFFHNTVFHRNTTQASTKHTYIYIQTYIWLIVNHTLDMYWEVLIILLCKSKQVSICLIMQLHCIRISSCVCAIFIVNTDNNASNNDLWLSVCNSKSVTKNIILEICWIQHPEHKNLKAEHFKGFCAFIIIKQCTYLYQ